MLHSEVSMMFSKFSVRIRQQIVPSKQAVIFGLMAMRKSSIYVFLNNTFQIKHQFKSCRNLGTEVSQKLATETAPKQEKLVKIAIIGTPNAGKSTFINNLLNHRICPTSSKVHTTRTFAKAIGIRNNAQIILYDTPGLVTEPEIKKYHLNSGFVSSCRHSIQHSDLIGVIHDVSNSWTRKALHSTVLDTLQAYPKVPSFLVLNKIDLLKSKRVLLDLTRTLTQNTLVPKGLKQQKSFVKKMTEVDKDNVDKIIGWPAFSNVFMVSSLNNDGMEDVMKFLLRHTKSSNWEYGTKEYTDQPPEEIITQSVRARLLDFLPQEIPYSLKCQIEFYNVYKGSILASVQVICPTERIERLICGIENGKLKQITERATSDLVETFSKPVSLTISTIAAKKKD